MKGYNIIGNTKFHELFPGWKKSALEEKKIFLTFKLRPECYDIKNIWYSRPSLFKISEGTNKFMPSLLKISEGMNEFRQLGKSISDP